MLYNFVLVSAKHQHESATGICKSLLGCHQHWVEIPASYSEFPLAFYFTYGNAYVSMLLSQVFNSFLRLLYPQVCSVCISTAALKIGSLAPSFQIPYI